MSRQIFCQKLQKEAEGLDTLPFPGPLGEKIYQHISKSAWQLWLNHQTMLINEYRLSLIEPSARQFLLAEMEKYFFGDNSAPPPGYSQPDKN